MAIGMAVSETQWAFLSHVFSWILHAEISSNHFQSHFGPETTTLLTYQFCTCSLDIGGPDVTPHSAAFNKSCQCLRLEPAVLSLYNILSLFTENQELSSFFPALFPEGNVDLELELGPR